MQRFRMSLLLVLSIIALSSGLAAGPVAYFADHVSGKTLGTSWTPKGLWTVVPDPNDDNERVLLTEALNWELPAIQTVVTAPQSYTLTFRARYDTPYAGISDGKQDGEHFPNWTVTLKAADGTTISLNDSYAWNSLALQLNGKPVAHLDGVRPKTLWQDYRLCVQQGAVRVYLNDQPVLTATTPAFAPTALSFNVMHEKLWLDDVALTAYQEPVLASDGRDPDALIREDFRRGVLSNGWQNDPAWKIIDDPEAPGHKVLGIDARESMSKLLSVATNYDEYTLEFRARFDTPYAPYPGNDNKHWPHWSVILASANGHDLRYCDSYIWSNQQVSLNDNILQHDTRAAQRGRWGTYRIIKEHQRLRVYLDGILVSDTPIARQPAGAIGFWVMNEQLWLDAITVQPHPASLLYETFANGIGTDNWQTPGWRIEVLAKNRALLGEGRMPLVTRAHIDNGVLGFKTCTKTASPWQVILKGEIMGDWSGLRVNPGTHTMEIGRMQAGIWQPSAKAALPATDGWQSWRITISGSICLVAVEGKRCVQGTLAQQGDAPIALQLLGGARWFDDVVVSPLPVPEYTVAPLEYGGIFLASQPQGVRLQLRNDDNESHRYSFTGTLASVGGKTIEPIAAASTVAPGATSPEQRLLVKPLAPGQYRVTYQLAADGVPFANATVPITVLPDLPVFSPAYHSKFGINGSVGENTELPALFHKLGVGWLRGSNVFTSLNKRTNGVWDYSEGERELSLLNTFRPIGTVNLYMDSGRGHTREGIDDVAAMFGRAAAHYAGKENLRYEVWNEPNHGGFWRLSPIDAADYTAVLKPAYLAVKAGDPQAKVLAPNSSGIAEDYFREACEQGALDYLDVVNCHPYGFPEVPEKRIPLAAAKLQAVIDDFGGWVQQHYTEHGYPTGVDSRSVSEEMQGWYLTRTHLLATTLDTMEGVDEYCTFDALDVKDIEACCGIVRHDGTQNPAYIALATMARQLANSDYLGRLPAPDGVYLCVYRSFTGKPLLVAWNMHNATATVTLPATGPVTVTDLYGVAKTIAAPQHSVVLTVGGAPIYVTGLPATILFSGIAQHRDEAATALRARIDRLSNDTVAQSLRSELAGIEQSAAHATAQAPAAQQTACMHGIAQAFALATHMIDAYRDKTITLADAASLTDYAERYAEVYGLWLLALAQPMPLTPTATALDAAHAAVTAKRGTRGSLVTAERMLTRAEEAAKLSKAATATLPDKAAVSALFSTQIANLAVAMANAESVFYRGTLFNVLPKNATLAAGTAQDFTLTLTNGTPNTLQTRIVAEYPAVWQQQPATQTLALPVDGHWQGTLKLQVPPTAAAGNYLIRLTVYAGDTTLGWSRIRLAVK